MPERQITVFLADDNLLVSEGARALINLVPDLVVVGAAALLGTEERLEYSLVGTR